MANETIALWQVQDDAGNGLEATAGATHTQLFNPDSRNPSDGAYIDDIQVDFRRAVPENESVDADNNEIQDMGVDGFDIVIHGFSGNADNNNASNLVNKFSKWLQDGNTSTAGPTNYYTKGRYGLRMDNAPQWNVNPTATYGYHIRNASFRYLGEKKDLVEFTISISLGGDLAGAL